MRVIFANGGNNGHIGLRKSSGTEHRGQPGHDSCHDSTGHSLGGYLPVDHRRGGKLACGNLSETDDTYYHETLKFSRSLLGIFGKERRMRTLKMESKNFDRQRNED